MEPECIIELADRAARNVRRRFGLQWSYEDFDDARQEAAEGIVRALRDAPEGVSHGYFFKAGAQGATRYAFRHHNLYAQSAGDRDDGSPLEAPSYGWKEELSDAQIPELRKILSRAARKGGARGGPKTRDQLAVARDLIILDELSRGATQAEIGKQLGISRQAVGTYRQRIRCYLAAAVQQKGV